MGMTIAVYRVDPGSGKRTVVRDRYDVRPMAAPTPLSAALPPCGCARCRKSERDGSVRDKWGTVQTP
jgi:hypothetical protein